MENYIIADCTYGLGNRLKCLVSAMRIADRSSRSLLLFWPKNKFANCNFSDLFENKIPEITREGLEVIRNKKDLSEQYEIIDTWRLLPLPEEDLPRHFARAHPSETGRNIDFEYERIPTAIRENILTYVKKLSPKQALLGKVEVFSRNFKARTLSVAIRTWIEAPERSVLFSFERMEALLDQNKDSDFFVSCDDKNVLEKMIYKYSGRVFFYPKRTRAGDRSSVEGMQDIFCDLLLLSRSHRMIASFGSSFPEMAWWFGGCRATVKLVPLRTWFFKIVPAKYPFLMYCLFHQWHPSPSLYLCLAIRWITRLFQYFSWKFSFFVLKLKQRLSSRKNFCDAPL